MLFNGVLGAVGLAMIIPLFVPSRWRARRAGEIEDILEFTPGLGETRVEPVPTQLTPIRATSLAPLPSAPWHDADDPGAPVGPGAP